MEKIYRLLSEHNEEFTNLVNDFYKKKYPMKKKKTIKSKIITMGRTYENITFTKNYINIIKDLSKIFSYGEISPFFGRFMSSTYEGFSESCVRKNTIIKINEGIYISVYSSNEKKIDHLTKLFNHYGIKLEVVAMETGESLIEKELQIKLL
jgi:hypothetical protein